MCGIAVPAIISQTTTGGPMVFQISTKAFPAGGTIPKQFTCDGQDFSPALTWTNAPESTKGFAIIADDPDAPAGTWTHWVIWNIPSSAHGLPENLPKEPRLADGAHQGRNDFRKTGYNGPCPPPGKPHRYFFKVFALDAPLDAKPGASRKEVEAAITQHTLAEAQVMGRYGR
jgi:Raf kinase inhibitor-like YbhB/YbcL family protein